MSVYDERVGGMTTLGDAHDHRNRDQAAFIAGAHWALDLIVGEADRFILAMSPDQIDRLAARLLAAAKSGDL